LKVSERARVRLAGKLTEYEFIKMKIRPVIGAQILSNVKFDFAVGGAARRLKRAARSF
jgi:hypothetical protein